MIKKTVRTKKIGQFTKTNNDQISRISLQTGF